MHELRRKEGKGRTLYVQGSWGKFHIGGMLSCLLQLNSTPPTSFVGRLELRAHRVRGQLHVAASSERHNFSPTMHSNADLAPLRARAFSRGLGGLKSHHLQHLHL